MSETIKSVFVFPNGMVMVFGDDGQQIPEYQGHKDEVLARIRAAYNGPIHEAEWKISQEPVTLDPPLAWTEKDI